MVYYHSLVIVCLILVNATVLPLLFCVTTYMLGVMTLKQSKKELDIVTSESQYVLQYFFIHHDIFQ